MSTELELLIKKRGIIKSKLTRFSNYLAKLSENNQTSHSDRALLQSKVTKLDAIFSDFSNIQYEIGVLDTDLEQHEHESEEFEEKFFQAHSLAHTILKASSSITSDTSGNHAPAQHESVATNKVVKPAINLPTFDGSFDKWYHFRDMFKSMIHSDSSLSNVEKLHYLNICLKGEAAVILNSVPISDNNYLMAWDLLNERFENKQLIVHSHVHALYTISSIKRDSYKALRELLDNVVWHLRSLENLELPVKHWDTLIIYLISAKLDVASKREWDAITCNNTNDLPTLEQLLSFLNKRCSLLGKSNLISENPPANKIKSSSLIATNNINCNYCNHAHFISQCDTFLKLTVNERINETKAKRLCLNCLGKGHGVASCKSKYSCKRCHKKHHSLLHIESIVPSISIPVPSIPSSSKTVVTHVGAKREVNQILLSTVRIRVADSSGCWHVARAILDSGSQSNFITTDLHEMLNLPSVQTNSTISGINQASIKLSRRADVRIHSMRTSFEATVDCLVIDKVTENMPAMSFDKSLLNIPNNITLADTTFNEEGKVDMLLGASIFWHLLCVGQIKLGENHPILHKTRLGWILSGPLPNNTLQMHNKQSCHFSVNLDHQLSKFWLIEECDIKRNWSIQEEECEKHFIDTTIRDQTGRFIVNVPFTSNKTSLGDSRRMALKRFYATERRLNQNPNLKRDYIDFMNEYEQLGHMKLINEDNSQVCQTYYLPHHAVTKATSTTTKTRVVFDASAKTTTGISLNDIQRVGPVIQDDILKILLRFRQHAFVLTADVEKMYRQVLIAETDRKYHRILWRPDSSQDVKCYELQTVTYGTASASFLATRCLQQAAMEHSSQYPEACKVICRDFYVDDLLTGANSICELEKLRYEITSILASVGFNLRKWLGNCSINFEHTSQSKQLPLGDDCESRTLGISWNSNIDAFKYEIAALQPAKHITKRSILSTTAKIFDPLGLLGPVIVVAKLIMQRLWQCQLSWDESVPQNLHYEWTKFLDEITSSTTISIPRFAFQLNSKIVECHGFADASERAYGACIYIRCLDISGLYKVNLLCAKSRVAPLRQITLPRLELCAAVLLTELFIKVRESLDIQFNSYFWSDSTITLSWIKSDSSRWQTFVANRVAKIQSHTNQRDWSHVRSQDNPADLLSRGTTPTHLANLSLWWHGPTWLSNSEQEWPRRITENSISTDQLPEVRRTVSLMAKMKCDLFEKFSCFTKLQRVTAWMLRFTKNCKLDRAERLYGPLKVLELESALTSLVKVAQAQAFPSDIKKLKNSDSQEKNCSLLSLNPFLDSNNILRVGGRINESNFRFNKKHPIILPKDHLLTDMIIIYEHRRLLHCGAQTVLFSLRDRFWPISGRCRIKKLIRNCITCFKSNPPQNQYLMGNLPYYRITQTNIFQNCGIDYAGPFMIKNRNGRGSKSSKAYICLFICMATKAVHLELVSSLSTEAFLATLRRFISRRGKPSAIYSDNGSNFVGAERELREFSKFANSDTMLDFSSNEGISWHFIPPRAPHFGGLWEAGVKSTKGHLKRVLSNASLTFENFCTTLTQIEAVLNSRPISPLSEDPTDLNPLTPGHFLIGRPLTALPERDVLAISENRLSQYQRIQRLVQHYWMRWSKEYISELQTRSRWKFNKQALLTVGALVILREENQPPCHWKLGRILQLHPGSDGIVRVVTVKTVQGTLKRPVMKICVLPMQSN